MNAKELSILEVLRAQCTYKVPYFQRAYVWSLENWEGLWETLVSGNKDNFLGSIILKTDNSKPGTRQQFLVIDGQQRITTLSILTAAFIDALNLRNDTDYEVYREFLFNKDSKLQNGTFVKTYSEKLINSRNDIVTYKRIINGEFSDSKDSGGEKSRLVECYFYFKNKILEANDEEQTNLKNNLSEESRKSLVQINLTNEDNEQAIFDTINSAGVRLTSSDIIKNNLFDQLSDLLNKDFSEVEKYFDSTWQETFEKDQETIDAWLQKRSVGRNERTNLELFLQTYAIMKPGLFDPTEKGVKLDNLAEAYKKYSANFNLEEHKAFINDICEFGKLYREYFIEMRADIIEHGIYYKEPGLSDDDNEIKHILQILGYMDTTTFDPYVLKVIQSKENVYSRIKDIETYIVRNYIDKQSTDKNFNKEAAQLVRDPEKYNANYFLQTKFIDDVSLMNSLKDIKSNDVGKLLLYWIELKRSFDQDSDTKCLAVNRKSHQLEHIMPQKWQDNWPISYPTVREDGTPFNEEEQEQINAELDAYRKGSVYQLGNMTLLDGKKNNDLSNASFIQKKNGFTMKNGKWIDGYCKSSKFLITNDILDQEIWTEETIKARTEKLFDEIKSIWPLQ